MKTRQILKYFLFVLVLWISIHVLVTIIDGTSDEGKTADIGVILGNKVNEDGSLSTRLTQRLECGLQLYKAGRLKHILVSGGLGKEGFYEGDKMKAYLTGKGVPDSVIFVDNNGNTTLQTVRNTLLLRKQLPFKKHYCNLSILPPHQN